MKPASADAGASGGAKHPLLNDAADAGASGGAKHPLLNDASDPLTDAGAPLADDDYALLGVAGDDLDDDPPAPETGLHALGQLGTAVVVVSALVLIGIVSAGVLGWIFR